MMDIVNYFSVFGRLIVQQIVKNISQFGNYVPSLTYHLVISTKSAKWLEMGTF